MSYPKNCSIIHHVLWYLTCDNSWYDGSRVVVGQERSGQHKGRGRATHQGSERRGRARGVCVWGRGGGGDGGWNRTAWTRPHSARQEKAKKGFMCASVRVCAGKSVFCLSFHWKKISRSAISLTVLVRLRVRVCCPVSDVTTVQADCDCSDSFQDNWSLSGAPMARTNKFGCSRSLSQAECAVFPTQD